MSAFNCEKYIEIQRAKILERISQFGNKLYLEIGGKLFDDFHASRVLPGFEPDSKLKMLLGLKEHAEIVIVVNSEDIIKRKMRSDIGISYDVEVERLILIYKSLGLDVSGVVLSFYTDNPNIKVFIKRLKALKIPVYKHYKIAGYPENIPLIVSEQGLGKNEYIKCSKPLVVVTAPGPGSGKLATCLSQLYHDNKNGVKSGYAKFETFPVWNLPLSHPINLAYESATVDLNDSNMIDPFHLEKYGISAVNYNRDIDAFPILKSIFEKIYGQSPYFSPTDMGVNMIGFAIENDSEVCEASKQEIIRRFYQAQKQNIFGSFTDESVTREQMLMNRLNISPNDRKCVKAAIEASKKAGVPVLSLELHDGTIIYGKRSTLLSASAAMLLNATKYLAKIDKSIHLISPNVIQPVQDLKVNTLKNPNPKIRANEILVALAIQASSNPLAELALSKLKDLEGCEAHSSSFMSPNDLNTLNKLGIRVTEEPANFVSKN